MSQISTIFLKDLDMKDFQEKSETKNRILSVEKLNFPIFLRSETK